MKLNALIVDDEFSGRKILMTLLRNYCNNYVEAIESVSSIEEAQKKLITQKFDLVFLDIQLHAGSGFDLIEKIPESTKIIFVTAFSEYAIPAIKNRAYDYFLKPVDPEELTKVVKKCYNFFQTQHKKFLSIKVKGITVPLELESIYLIKAKGPYSEIHEISGKVFVTSQTLKMLEPKLNDHYLRVHKSFIINKQFIKGFNQKEVYLQEVCVPVSRTGLVALQEYYSS
jgi:two-component system LytT family response regulator